MRRGLLFALFFLVCAAVARRRDCAADVVFIMDQSSSILPHHFTQQKKFVKDMIDMFDVGRDRTRVSLIKFAAEARMVFSLQRFFTKDNMFLMLDHIEQQGGETNTGEAMRVAREHVLTRQYGARLDDPNIPQIVIVITDGNSQDKAVTIEESRLTKESGATVFAIGVGKNVSQEELETIASGKEHIFAVESYDVLHSIKKTLGKQTCNVEPTPPPEHILSDCQDKKLDLAIVLDKSSNVDEYDFAEMKRFTKSLLYSFQIDDKATRISLISYSDASKVHSYLNEFNQRGKLANHLYSLDQKPGKSNTVGAFKVLRSVFNPKYGARTKVAKAALFITNTRTTDYEVAIDEVEKLHLEYGVEIFAVTVGPQASIKEWKGLTGGKVLHKEEYGDLDAMSLRNDVAELICPVQPPPQDFPCGEKNPADIAFALDTINAGSNGLSSVSSFLRDVAGKFEIGPDKIQISLLKKPCHQVNGFDLDTHSNKSQVMNALQVDIRMNTVNVLNKMVNETFTTAKGARDVSSGAKRFAVLFMDGTPGNQKQVAEAAENAKRNGQIELFVIGIGDKVRRSVLEEIATSPKHVFTVQSYGDLAGNGSPASAISDAICKIRVKRSFVRSL